MPVGRSHSDSSIVRVRFPALIATPRSSFPQCRAVLGHSGSDLTFHLNVPQAPETHIPRRPCGRAEPSDQLSLQPPEFCPPPDGIPLQITVCCLQFPFIPIKTTLVALESSPWEYLCVCFYHPLPRVRLGFSLPGGCLESSLSFRQWGGWASATSGPSLPCPTWVSVVTCHFKDLVGASRYSLFC